MIGFHKIIFINLCPLRKLNSILEILEVQRRQRILTEGEF